MKINLDNAIALTNTAYQTAKHQVGNLAGHAVSALRQGANVLKSNLNYKNLQTITFFATGCFAMNRLLPLIEKSKGMTTLNRKLAGTRVQKFAKAHKQGFRNAAIVTGALFYTGLSKLLIAAVKR